MHNEIQTEILFYIISSFYLILIFGGFLIAYLLTWFGTDVVYC